MTTPDRIRLTGVTARGHHGVLAHERRDGQRFVVDATLELDTRAAARTDDLSATVDYAQAARRIVDRIAGDPVDLIERLAGLIAADLLALPRIDAVEVVVHKPEAPIEVPFADVSVTIRRERAAESGAGGGSR
jgi:dihydroneopterin aldolase